MNWLWWKIDWPATALIHAGGPSSTPSARAVRTSCRASYDSTHSAASCPMKRRECGAQPRVRRPTTARRTGRPTGAARRRARSRTDTSAVGERLGELVSRSEPLEIRVDEQMHEPFEVERRRPAQLLARFRRVTDEIVELSLPTHERIVDPNVLLPVEPDAGERALRRARGRCGSRPSRSRSPPASSRWIISHIART